MDATYWYSCPCSCGGVRAIYPIALFVCVTGILMVVVVAVCHGDLALVDQIGDLVGCGALETGVPEVGFCFVVCSVDYAGEVLDEGGVRCGGGGEDGDFYVV